MMLSMQAFARPTVSIRIWISASDVQFFAARRWFCSMK
jgi:hypothetical protein